ncbi:hypothetical protein QYM36_000466 [Artemia franciscana]|uniref:Uncharacterized protein n=1 Tax=Artemia franciscana TaxID=6661 RepID=A0AA88LC64_ARTSF|nr:hypothetical protein QYM36_000466 [Artemia franciscana]
MAYTPVQVHIPVGINGLDQRRDSSSSPGSYLSCVSPGQASSISGRSSNGTAASSPQFFNPADFKPLRRPKTTGEEDNKVTTANRTMNYAEEIQLLKQKIDDMGKEKTDLLMDVFESNSVCHEQAEQISGLLKKIENFALEKESLEANLEEASKHIQGLKARHFDEVKSLQSKVDELVLKIQEKDEEITLLKCDSSRSGKNIKTQIAEMEKKLLEEKAAHDKNLLKMEADYALRVKGMKDLVYEVLRGLDRTELEHAPLESPPPTPDWYQNVERSQLLIQNSERLFHEAKDEATSASLSTIQCQENAISNPANELKELEKKETAILKKLMTLPSLGLNDNDRKIVSEKLKAEMKEIQRMKITLQYRNGEIVSWMPK